MLRKKYKRSVLLTGYTYAYLLTIVALILLIIHIIEDGFRPMTDAKYIMQNFISIFILVCYPFYILISIKYCWYYIAIKGDTLVLVNMFMKSRNVTYDISIIKYISFVEDSYRPKLEPISIRVTTTDKVNNKKIKLALVGRKQVAALIYDLKFKGINITTVPKSYKKYMHKKNLL